MSAPEPTAEHIAEARSVIRLGASALQIGRALAAAAAAAAEARGLERGRKEGGPAPLAVTFTLSDMPTPYKDVPVGRFFAFVGSIDGILLCYRCDGDGFRYITLGGDDEDSGPSLRGDIKCHPDNKVRLVTLTRSPVPDSKEPR